MGLKYYDRQAAGFFVCVGSWGHSSFVFPHLCLAKSKVCPPFAKKSNFLTYFHNCCHTVVVAVRYNYKKYLILIKKSS